MWLCFSMGSPDSPLEFYGFELINSADIYYDFHFSTNKAD